MLTEGAQAKNACTTANHIYTSGIKPAESTYYIHTVNALTANLGGKPTMDQLQQLIRQAELQQKNLELDLLFRKNMDFFEKAEPNIFNKYHNYTPTELQLIFNNEGYINLYNMGENTHAVYSKDPYEFCKEYVEKYQEMPTFYRVTARTTKAIDPENDAHIHNMNPLIEFMNSKEEKQTSFLPLEAKTQFMLVHGIGIGYHIPMILEKTDVQHMCIIEPHEDNFYASLHTIDWRAIYDYFDREYSTFNLILGKTANDSFHLIRQYLNQIGLFNSAKPYVFDHLSSPEMRESTTVFFEKLPTMLGAMGYFDDEQVSLSHTVANYSEQRNILRDHVQLNHQTINRPVFVVANGPSLDHCVDFLRTHQHEVIIFSCGTALGSLRKAGIKPDFHIEMERTRPVVEWIETSTTPEYREDIICLGLNTVHPDTYALFNTTGMGMKSNDLGTHFICQYIGDNEFVVNFALCNPTVGNTGVAYAAALGFKNIYLVGLDLGFASDGTHHSSLSKHYDVKDEHQESLNLYKAETAGNKKFPGNFGGEVISTPVYAHSRISIETLLKQYPHINCYNTSNGVYIRGTTPMPITDITIEPSEPIDKKLFSHNLYEKYFNIKGLRKIESMEKIAEYFRPAIDFCDEMEKLFSYKAKSRADAFKMLAKQHKRALQVGLNSKTQYAYSIMKGSVHSFDFVLAKCLYNGKSQEEGVEIFNKGVEHYRQFLAQAKQKIKSSLLKKDARSRNLSQKLKH
ncbi:motility associated factor glycosyltransferase family protein [Cellvibrio fibrivorans]|uniref:DUF115 domain-containing protein n=2 Tax=Cellvibrio TaxID=10 RepID=A0ABU1UWB2_9GAMM|nr:6-hydroxymethylpterin diphosphokinase MptE-like protein [Cellvibrio fibrivorans]MDR7089422.1 hypothetical protein [Cellvibrio fibrivorans]